MVDQSWQVNILFTEEGDRTRADAIFETAGERFHGVGHARRAPHDPDVPLIGKDLAAARALSELSHHLLDAAAARIERFEGRPVKVHG